MIATIAAHHVVALHRRRVLGVVVGSLVANALLAGILGWASHTTIIGVFDESARLLASRGLGAPPNPFLLKPPLAVLSNMVVYVTMIGALVAAVLGHLLVAEDATTAVGRLVFSRRVSRSQYAGGTIAASAIVLGLAMLGCMVVSVLALAVVGPTLPSVANVGRLALFFGFSWLYLLAFALVGMANLLATGRRSLGLLSAMGVWLVVTFAIPQFTSGLRPTQSLNPIVDPVSTSQTFFRITGRARPLSISEQFKTASAQLLNTAPEVSISETLRRVLTVAIVAGAMASITVRLVQRHDVSKVHAGE